MSVTATPVAPPIIVSAHPPSLAGLLRRAPLFQLLRDDLIDALAAITREAMLPNETAICRQGDQPRYLYVLLDGRVALWASAGEDSRAALEVVRPPGYFELATALSHLPHLTTAQCVSPCHVLMIDSRGLAELVARDVALANTLLRAEALNFRLLVRQVQDLKLRTAAQRLGCYLLALSSSPKANTDQFRLPFDKRLLAARLGCRQENLSRAFAALRSFGVETHGARVILHDIPALRDFAVPDDAADPGLPFSG